MIIDKNQTMDSHFSFIASLTKAYINETWFNLTQAQYDDIISGSVWEGQFERINDWRNYVNGCYVAIWDCLSEREKIIIYCMASEQAHKES